MENVNTTTLEQSKVRSGELFRLSCKLAFSKGRIRSGESWLFALSVLAFASVSALAIIVAAGVRMFVERGFHPRGLVAKVIAQDPSSTTINSIYIYLAAFALVLLIGPMVSLAASAASVGARSREDRLSVLRLIGLSSGQVARVAFWETSVQAVIGIALGIGVHFLFLPALTTLSFQTERIALSEILMPPLYYLAVGAAILFVSLVSLWFGLAGVRISPLGVARRSLPKALRSWRLVLLLSYLLPLLVRKMGMCRN